MKKMMMLAALVLLYCVVSAQQQKYSKVKIYTGSEGVMKIAALGIPVDEGFFKKGEYMMVELSENDLKKLDENGFLYDVLINDMTAFYVDRNLHPEKYETPVKSTGCETVPDIQTPSHFVLGSVGGFYTLAELYAQLDSMRVNYPDLISVKQQAGTINSIEGRPTYYVRISDNPDNDESEPEVMYTALNHAREPMGMQQLVFFMWYLMENYGSDNEIKQLLDHTELYFIPCVNPDGYNNNCVSEPSGGGLWRKNRRDNGDGSYGIDLNRNYGYEWGYDDNGSSPTPSDETYRGTAAFSEPETQTIKWFSENKEIVLAIDYHCYGNVLIYPWSYVESLETPDSLYYRACSDHMTAVNGYAAGTPDQTVGYTANGGSVDWYYGEQTTKNKIICFSPEAGDADDGFWPASNRIEDISKINVEQNMYIARFAGKYADVNDLSSSILAEQSGYFNYSIQRLGLADPATFTVSILPLTSNIVSSGSPKVYSSLAILQEAIDSIEYTFSSGILNGETVQYLLCVDNGLYTVSDTITKIYGSPVIAFNDDCSSITNWTAGGWALCTSQYYSASASIADSPIGNYSNNTNKSITLNSTIDLTNCTVALMNFWTKWNIEEGFDYVQLKASADGGSSWTPLCGKYTNQGSSYQVQDSPLYDGIQNTWVYEEIDLGDYIGQEISLQITIVSDGYLECDGYYFDDINVVKINGAIAEITSLNQDNNMLLSEPYPNPAGDIVSVSYSLNNNNKSVELVILNGVGQSVFKIRPDNEEGIINVDISSFEQGIYFCYIKDDASFSGMRKLIIIK